MKSNAFIMALVMAVASCNSESGQQNSPEGNGGHAAASLSVASADPVFISLDEANSMIKSYLTSIQYPGNDSDLRSLLYNADSLRAYLQDTSIRQLKMMFAGTSTTPDAPGGYGQGTTIIIAGVDGNGNYKLFKDVAAAALDRAIPCPKNCMVEGTASRDTIVAEAQVQ